VVHDVVVAGEHPVREPVVAHERPHVLLRFSSEHFARNATMVMLSGTTSLADMCQPALSTSSRTCRVGATLAESSARNSVVASMLHQGRIKPAALPSLGQMAKDVGGRRALILRGRGARSLLRPAAGDLVLLADTRLVAEPDLYVVRIDALLTRDRVQTRGEVFLKGSIAPSACA